jgi:multifunctional methyltransferase subunit TRM112
MRLLSHNLLICNVAKCEKNNFPLIIEVEKSIYRSSDFNRENIKKLVRKLDWFALYKTVTDMGETSFPKDLTAEYLENEENLRKLHRIILDVTFYLFRPTSSRVSLSVPTARGSILLSTAFRI